MSRPWELTLTVDARGHDDTQVRVVRTGPQHLPHLRVRTGSLLVHCLDAGAVNSVAEAWATARVRMGDLLVREAAPPRHPAQQGAAYPVGEVILEGRQSWSITEPHATQFDGLVTVGCLRVRVHDRVALDTQVRAWSEAAAHARHIFGGRTPPFGRLLEQARITAVQQAAREHDRSVGRGRPRPTQR